MCHTLNELAQYCHTPGACLYVECLQSISHPRARANLYYTGQNIGQLRKIGFINTCMSQFSPFIPVQCLVHILHTCIYYLTNNGAYNVQSLSLSWSVVFDLLRPSMPRSLAPVKNLRMAISTSFCDAVLVVALLPAASVITHLKLYQTSQNIAKLYIMSREKWCSAITKAYTTQCMETSKNTCKMTQTPAR